MRLVVAISLFCTTPLAAQSHPGLVFDQVMHLARANGAATATDSAIIHVTATSGNIKLEVNGDMPGMRPMPNGKTTVMMITDSGAKMTFISPAEKQYMSFNPAQMMEGAQKMMQGMGGSITLDTTVTRVSVDSLGTGPTILGHSTLHYRVNSRFRVSISMMGEAADVEQQSTEDLYTAPDLDDVRTIGQGMTRLNDLAASMGFARDFVDRVRKAHESIRGMPLRVVKEETRTARGVTQKSTTTMEVTNLKRVAVPDSVFAIPADYKQLSMPMPPAVGALLQ